MSEIILTKTASTGQAVEVRLQEVLPGQFRALLYLDGKWSDGPSRPEALPQAKGDITHYLGRKPAVGFTANETAVILAEIALATSKARTTPEGQLRTLRQERAALVATYHGLQDDARAAFDRGMESDGSAAWTAKQRFDTRINAAWAAIQSFDAAHPEVMDAINAEKQAAMERFLAAD